MLLVEKGLVASREKGQRLILAGQVFVDGHPSTKAGVQIPDTADIRIATPPRFVSRGGDKLEAAIQAFGINLNGVIGMDVGAATGGFTDCMLQHGATRVLAVDVGKGQLDDKLRSDPRVTYVNQTNARNLHPSDLPAIPAFAAIDVSFISLTKVLPSVTEVLAVPSELVTLIKPQFEAGRENIMKGGVVRDPLIRKAVVSMIRTFGANLGLREQGCIESPLKGPAGNVEFLMYWRKEPVQG